MTKIYLKRHIYINYPCVISFGDKMIAAMYENISNFYYKLTEENLEYKEINIFGIGTSGAWFITVWKMFILQKRLPELCDINFVILSKNGEQNHRGNTVMMLQDSVNVIVDDFVETGETVNEIIKITDLGREYPFYALMIMGDVSHNIEKKLTAEPQYFFGQNYNNES